ncbi:hypothetical protein QFZ73_000821 [Peribacillus sp. V2I11]|nr:hypothetical protein [Peribacillus sp. V2I11]
MGSFIGFPLLSTKRGSDCSLFPKHHFKRKLCFLLFSTDEALNRLKEFGTHLRNNWLAETPAGKTRPRETPQAQDEEDPGPPAKNECLEWTNSTNLKKLQANWLFFSYSTVWGILYWIPFLFHHYPGNNIEVITMINIFVFI